MPNPVGVVPLSRTLQTGKSNPIYPLFREAHFKVSKRIFSSTFLECSVLLNQSRSDCYSVCLLSQVTQSMLILTSFLSVRWTSAAVTVFNVDEE